MIPAPGLQTNFKQVEASGRRQEILKCRGLGAGLGKSQANLGNWAATRTPEKQALGSWAAQVEATEQQCENVMDKPISITSQVSIPPLATDVWGTYIMYMRFTEVHVYIYCFYTYTS